MEEIKKFLEEFLIKAGFEDGIADLYSEEKEKVLNISLRVNDSGFLIGAGGQNLTALEHILRLLVLKYVGPEWRVFLDINNYRQGQDDVLKDMAKKLARQVSLTKKQIELEPMNSRHRRIIHTELALNADVFTESIGEGLDRHIVIKPITETI